MLNLALTDQMAGDASWAAVGSVLPEVHRLPGAKEQLSVLNAQGQRLTGQRGADVCGHVVVAFVLMPITGSVALAVERASAVLGNGGIHPGVQVVEDPWIGVFINGEAGAGVQTGEVHHAQMNSTTADPGVEFFVEPGESCPRGADHQLMKHLIHGDLWPFSLALSPA